jgi:hypothetical protein
MLYFLNSSFEVVVYGPDSIINILYIASLIFWIVRFGESKEEYGRGFSLVQQHC